MTPKDILQLESSDMRLKRTGAGMLMSIQPTESKNL